MGENSNEVFRRVVVKSSEEDTMIAQAVAEGFAPGKMPLKIVTGTQETSNLHFELQSGAIVAHPGSTVIFVCG
jgi:hypothetical protein